jgi:hypothetical protein
MVQLLPQPVRALLGIWFSLGFLPVFVTMFYRFVPSTEWISTTSIPGLGVGLATAALVAWLVLKALPTASASGMKKIAIVVSAPFLGYLLGKNAAVIAVPMILALIVGHQVELPFTVVRADGNRTKGCSSPVELQGLPLLFDRVCGIPNEFRQSLTPGGRILVIGRGTSLGVYAESLRQID